MLGVIERTCGFCIASHTQNRAANRTHAYIVPHNHCIVASSYILFYDNGSFGMKSGTLAVRRCALRLHQVTSAFECDAVKAAHETHETAYNALAVFAQCGRALNSGLCFVCIFFALLLYTILILLMSYCSVVDASCDTQSDDDIVPRRRS